MNARLKEFSERFHLINENMNEVFVEKEFEDNIIKSWNNERLILFHINVLFECGRF